MSIKQKFSGLETNLSIPISRHSKLQSLPDPASTCHGLLALPDGPRLSRRPLSNPLGAEKSKSPASDLCLGLNNDQSGESGESGEGEMALWSYVVQIPIKLSYHTTSRGSPAGFYRLLEQFGTCLTNLALGTGRKKKFRGPEIDVSGFPR